MATIHAFQRPVHNFHVLTVKCCRSDYVRQVVIGCSSYRDYIRGALYTQNLLHFRYFMLADFNYFSHATCTNVQTCAVVNVTH